MNMAGVQSCELAMPPPPPSDATLQVVITRVFVNKLPKKSLYDVVSVQRLCAPQFGETSICVWIRVMGSATDVARSFGKCNPFVKVLWNGDVVVHTPIQKGGTTYM